MTSLKLTLTLKPNVWQTIYFQLYAPGAYQEYILVKPIMLSQSTSLPYVSSVSDSLENMVYISIDKAYYEGITTDQTTSAVNQLTYYIPMFTANSVRPLVNFTYNLTVNSISIFGNFIFTTTTPAAFTTTLTNTWTLISPSATDVYKQMCTGGPFEFTLNMCPVERRCSFYTYWINRIFNGIAALNVTKVNVQHVNPDVWLSTSFSLNLTSESSYVRVDYGPSCLINQYLYCTQFKHTLYLMGDCNVTTTINYAFPTFVNVSGSTKNFTGQTLVLSPIPSFPIYTDIMIEVSPTSVTLQPGQITTINVKYIFPLNSTYLKSTIQISGTGSNNTNESVITIADFKISLGSNLFYTTTAYSSNYLSTYPTDQNDQLLIYFENIINIGTVSVPIMRNTLSLSVDIQLSDSKIVENGTVWPLQITGRFNAVTNISKISVSCVRTGSEKPSIQVVLSQLSSFTFSDYPDRDVVYLQTTVQMMNGTGLECERQSIIFYLSPEIKSISVVNQTGNIDNVTLKTPLNPVTKSVQFIAGRLYFGAKYEVIFSLKFNPSRSTTIVKYPILVEIVCKPYERGSPVVNSCAKQRFYKFKSHLRVQLDYTYPPNLPHYVAMRNPLVQLPDRQANTFLNVGDLLFYCARAFSMKGSLDLVRRCFKIGKLPERIWFDVGPYVEQIIAYTNPLGILFGLGANGGGVMMSKDLGKTWISINSFMYQRTLNTSTEIITASVIPWISFTGSIDNTLSKSFCKMRVAKQWDVHRIPKFTQTVFTFEIKFSNWINGSLIGSLSLSDENSSLASCGSVRFNIVPGSNYLPVAIDGTAGILKIIESDYETMKNNHTITFQVTVRNANTSLNISDDATVNILIDENYSDEETESEITAVKRGVILPPNTINVTFSRVYIQDNPNYCLFDTWFIDSPSSFLMTSQILVSSDPADDEKNVSIRMRFKTGLFPEMTPPPMGTSLVVTTEALLTPKITVDFSMVVSSNCPTQYDAVNFIKCPQSVNYGGVYDYSVNFFISRPIGDYTFTFSTDQYSASIGHISLTLSPTFATYPEGYKINTEEFVTSNAVLTTFGYVRLISEYTISNSRRSGSSTLLGIFENKNARNITYNFVFGIKLRYDTSYVTGDVIQIQFTLSTDTLAVNTQNVVFSINSMVQPPSIIPPSKVPTLTIEKIEPRNSQPLVNFTTIVECRAKFFEDLVYTPVTLVIQVNPAYGIIIRQNIQTVGYLLKTMAPVSPSYITKP
ncbi:unnamed protein product [Schistosoma bovis]|nr:unnamed protein product [Schistosoma bovis]